MKKQIPTQKELFLALWQARIGMLAVAADGSWTMPESTARADDWVDYWHSCGSIAEAISDFEAAK